MLKTKLLTIILLLNQFILFSQNKIVINNLSDDKKIITEEQEKLIFECAKNYPNNSQISIALIENGIAKYYGVKIQNDTAYYSDNYNKVFEIGSISKVFNSTLLANFVLDEKLKLDDTINNYLPFKLNDDIKITFKQLANHTSGLPVWPSNLITFKESYSEQKLNDYLITILR